MKALATGAAQPQYDKRHVTLVEREPVPVVVDVGQHLPGEVVLERAVRGQHEGGPLRGQTPGGGRPVLLRLKGLGGEGHVRRLPALPPASAVDADAAVLR